MITIIIDRPTARQWCYKKLRNSIQRHDLEQHQLSAFISFCFFCIMLTCFNEYHLQMSIFGRRDVFDNSSIPNDVLLKNSTEIKANYFWVSWKEKQVILSQGSGKEVGACIGLCGRCGDHDIYIYPLYDWASIA